MATITIEVEVHFCPECNRNVPSNHWYEDEGVCWHCNETKFIVCYDCDRRVRVDDCIDNTCSDCLHTCSDCDNEVSSRYWMEERDCCVNCYYDLYEECDRCGNVFDRNDQGDQICPDCQSNRWNCLVSDCALLVPVGRIGKSLPSLLELSILGVNSIVRVSAVVLVRVIGTIVTVVVVVGIVPDVMVIWISYQPKRSRRFLTSMTIVRAFGVRVVVCFLSNIGVVSV